jgi:hypothetical protein
MICVIAREFYVCDVCKFNFCDGMSNAFFKFLKENLNFRQPTEVNRTITSVG